MNLLDGKGCVPQEVTYNKDADWEKMQTTTTKSRLILLPPHPGLARGELLLEMFKVELGRGLRSELWLRIWHLPPSHWLDNLDIFLIWGPCCALSFSHMKLCKSSQYQVNAFARGASLVRDATSLVHRSFKHLIWNVWSYKDVLINILFRVSTVSAASRRALDATQVSELLATMTLITWSFSHEHLHHNFDAETWCLSDQFDDS